MCVCVWAQAVMSVCGATCCYALDAWIVSYLMLLLLTLFEVDVCRQGLVMMSAAMVMRLWHCLRCHWAALFPLSEGALCVAAISSQLLLLTGQSVLTAALCSTPLGSCCRRGTWTVLEGLQDASDIAH